MAGRLGGALSGAGGGALAGSAFGPIGTAVGAGLGGISGYLSGSDKDKFRKIPTQTKEQQQFLNNILQQLQGGGAGGLYGQSQDYLSRILSGDKEAYDRFAAPYLQNFQEQIVPGIAERFGALGGPMGQGQVSSGLAQTLGGAGANLQSQLANLYANMQQNAAQQAQGQYNYLSGLGLGTQAFQPGYQPGNIGFGGQLLGGIGQGYGQAFGRQAGYNTANKFGNMFGGDSSTNSNLGFGNAGLYPTEGNFNPYTG